MLATLIAAGILGIHDPLQTPPPRPERPIVKEVLDTGGVILIDRRPEEKTISITLTVSARGVEDTPETHGWRHLLEHFAAKGRSGAIDRPLETAKWFMVAQTTRDASQYQFKGPAGSIAPAVKAIEDILAGPVITQEAIAKEISTLHDEEGIIEDPLLLSNAAWKAAYGDAGLSPFGDLKVMAGATPQQLQELFRKQYARDQIVICVVGPVEPNPTLTALELAISKAPLAVKSTSARRPVGKPATTDAPDARGSGIAALCNGLNDSKTMAVIAAALALTVELDEPFFMYEPTLQRSMVTVGSQTLPLSEVRKRVDEAIARSQARLWSASQLFLRLYVEIELSSPMLAASFMGEIQSQSTNYRIETYRDYAEQVTYQDFAEALKLFESSRSVNVDGGRR